MFRLYPRFQINLLSPSLFSLHNQGEGIENLTSLSTILSAMPLREQQIWLDLVMEASGVNDQKEKLEKVSVNEKGLERLECS